MIVAVLYQYYLTSTEDARIQLKVWDKVLGVMFKDKIRSELFIFWEPLNFPQFLINLSFTSLFGK